MAGYISEFLITSQNQWSLLSTTRCSAEIMLSWSPEHPHGLTQWMLFNAHHSGTQQQFQSCLPLALFLCLTVAPCSLHYQFHVLLVLSSFFSDTLIFSKTVLLFLASKKSLFLGFLHVLSIYCSQMNMAMSVASKTTPMLPNLCLQPDGPCDSPFRFPSCLSECPTGLLNLTLTSRKLLDLLQPMSL